MRRCLAAAALAVSALTLSPAARADEAWSTPHNGDVVYEADFGETAMLSYTGSRTGRRAHLYLPGMAGAQDRGIFYGYWIEPTGGEACGGELTGPDGTRSRTWGQAILTFDRPGFPSGWTAVLGECFSPPFEFMRAEPF